MKAASPATRSEWESAFEATAMPLSEKDSELEVHDCSAAVAEYDPVVNYLLPRPRFLRYDPNRRLEVLRRMQSFEASLDSEMESSSSETSDSSSSSSSSMEGLNFLSCPSEELSDDQTLLHQEGAIGLIGMVGVGEPRAQQVVVEGLELEEEDDDDDDEEKIRWSWWRPSLVLESLLVLGLLLILAPLYVSFVYSTSGVTFGEGGGGLLDIHDPLPHPSRFTFEKLIASPFSDFGVTSSRDVVDINSSIDVMNGDVYKFATPNPGLEEMVVANTLLEEENLVLISDLSQIGLMDMEDESLATLQTVVENVDELHDIVEADEKQYSEVEEMANGIDVVPFSEELEQFEMVLPSFMHGSIEPIVDQQPLSNKLSLNGIVSLSMEPTCNTYGITSSYGESLRLEENGNHLFPPNARNCSFLSSMQTAVLMLIAMLSSFICLKFMKGRNSSPSTANASTIGRGTNQERRLSPSLSNADSTSYGSITIQKDVVIKQEVVSTPVRRSSRLRNRTPPLIVVNNGLFEEHCQP